MEAVLPEKIRRQFIITVDRSHSRESKLPKVKQFLQKVKKLLPNLQVGGSQSQVREISETWREDVRSVHLVLVVGRVNHNEWGTCLDPSKKCIN